MERRIRVPIHHGLYSRPHFANVSHSSVVGIERRLPIKGYFLGPGGRFRRWRWPPFIQYTTKTVRVLRTKASWVSVIICGKALNQELCARMIINQIIPSLNVRVAWLGIVLWRYAIRSEGWKIDEISMKLYFNVRKRQRCVKANRCQWYTKWVKTQKTTWKTYENPCHCHSRNNFPYLVSDSQVL